MARKPGEKYPKRARERIIQGWFDPHVAEDKAILDIVDRVMVEEGLTQKQIISISVMTHAEETWGSDAVKQLIADSKNPYHETVSQMVDRMEKQDRRLEEIYDLLSSGQLVAASPNGSNALEQIKRDAAEFDQVSQSIGGSYRVYGEDE